MAHGIVHSTCRHMSITMFVNHTFSDITVYKSATVPDLNSRQMFLELLYLNQRLQNTNNYTVFTNYVTNVCTAVTVAVLTFYFSYSDTFLSSTDLQQNKMKHVFLIDNLYTYLGLVDIRLIRTCLLFKYA